MDRLGKGLIVSAYAGDGTVEAVELTDERWVLGVQWHPEMGEDVRVMTALVTAATRETLPGGSSGLSACPSRSG